VKCSKEFEAMQKFSDEPIGTCPSCGGKAKRLISRSSFQLKGSGWYLTDYARKGSSSGSEGDSGSSRKDSADSPPSSSTGSSDD